MTYSISWEPPATNAAVRFPWEVPTGPAAVYEAVHALATQPRPADSAPYGSPDIRRLYVGDYRVLYVIDNEVIHIMVTHLGRTPCIHTESRARHPSRGAALRLSRRQPFRSPATWPTTGMLPIDCA